LIVSESGGTSSPEPAAMTAGAGLKKLWVKEVTQRLDMDIPKEQGVYAQSPGCNINFLGQLPGKVLKVKNGKIETAIADNGDNMLPAEDHKRKTQSAWLTGRDKNFIQFSVQLSPLPAAAKGLKELTGWLTYMVGAGEKKVDLGELELKKDATGKALNAKVTEVKEKFRRIKIQLDVESLESVKIVNFTDAAGNKLDFSSSGHNSWNNKHVLSFRFGGDTLPKKANVTVVLFEKIETRRMPFAANNLKLR